MFAVGLSIACIILASNGLGSNDFGALGVLTLKKANRIQKVYYASELLYVSTLGFSKLSLLSFFYGIYHQRGQRRIVLAIGIFVSVCTLALLATVAFQCGLPKPWEILTLRCFNTVSLAGGLQVAQVLL